MKNNKNRTNNNNNNNGNNIIIKISRENENLYQLQPKHWQLTMIKNISIKMVSTKKINIKMRMFLRNIMMGNIMTLLVHLFL